MADTSIPPQQQEPPGETGAMRPEPRDSMADYTGRGLLAGRRALITGGDSGIGRAVAVGFAKEGASVAIAYLSEHEDAERTADLVRVTGQECVLLPGDLGDPAHCRDVVEQTVHHLHGLDVLVNNVATQQPVDSPEELTEEQWLRTFEVNLHSYFRVTAAALPFLGKDAAIINTASVNGLRGHRQLIDYSATKGAIIAWTYSMAQALAERGIRVNCVAPGPVWTPSIPSTFDPQPNEIAPTYIFLAAELIGNGVFVLGSAP